MARAARLYAQMDVNYFEDDRILAAGDAWQLHFAGVLFCKRNLTDGRLSRRQLTRIAPESVGDVEGAIETLERVGLFGIDGDEISIRSWSDWNESAEDVEAMSKGGEMGNHLRWHVRKNIVKSDCPLCTGQEASRPDIAPDSGDESQSRGRLEADTYADEEPESPPAASSLVHVNEPRLASQAKKTAHELTVLAMEQPTRPAGKNAFPKALTIIEAILVAGHAAEAVESAIRTGPIVWSIGGFELALQKCSAANGHRTSRNVNTIDATLAQMPELAAR